MFELANAYRSFGAVKALEDINLSVAKGERVAFIGASGSGKTTLLRLLGAQLAPDRGSVQVLGRDPLELG
ncbi:MAG: ATP-binding cassette domain-containing protein, partial [Verrucomicrobiota bacterium]|nr:ATP-binding cassette domain-containing protein [Verrucomicrobiota bacterium]